MRSLRPQRMRGRGGVLAKSAEGAKGRGGEKEEGKLAKNDILGVR